ncbi:hypothetical protein Hanom_Chr05g00392371 [Helianthus anomalus]
MTKETTEDYSVATLVHLVVAIITTMVTDPTFDFVYEALTWFVLSNCLNFAFKRIVRIFVDGSADPWCLIFKPMWWPPSRTKKSQTAHLCSLHKINTIIFITTTLAFHHLQNPIQQTRKRPMLTTVVVLLLCLH